MQVLKDFNALKIGSRRSINVTPTPSIPIAGVGFLLGYARPLLSNRYSLAGDAFPRIRVACWVLSKLEKVCF